MNAHPHIIGEVRIIYNICTCYKKEVFGTKKLSG